ncbi:MAG: dihydroneopterin aldolase [Gammaproteobacteria bacterium]|nr:dihydroneopterin aldolase [Gammaproteobacteria bacterium]
MDTLVIRGLKIHTLIGTLPLERELKQILLLDLTLHTNIQKAAEEDNLQHTIDYAEVCKVVVQFGESSSFQLIETLAERTACLLLEKFHIKALRVSVRKPGALREAAEVGITIERSAVP